MQAAGGVKYVLLLPEERGQGVEEFRADLSLFFRSGGRAYGPQGIDGRFATDPATGAGIKMALKPAQVERYLLMQPDADAVRGRLHTAPICLVGGGDTSIIWIFLVDGYNCGGVGNDAFREQKAYSQFRVMARRAHGDGNALIDASPGGAVL